MSYFPYPSKEVKKPFLKPLVWKEVPDEDLPTFVAKCNGEIYYQLVYDKRHARAFRVIYCYRAWDYWSECYSIFPIESQTYETKIAAENAIEQCRHNLAKEILSKEAIAKLKSK
jgi:hypothetical protein